MLATRSSLSSALQRLETRLRGLAANGFGVDVKGTTLNRRGMYCGNRPEPADVAYFRAENLSQHAAVVFLTFD